MLLNRETCNDAIMMIQPAMQAYSMGNPQAEPVMLDVASVMPDRVLLLDSYFTVVVWHGSTVAQWRKADYHLQEEYAHLKPLMEVSTQTTCGYRCRASAGMRLARWVVKPEGSETSVEKLLNCPVQLYAQDHPAQRPTYQVEEQGQVVCCSCLFDASICS